MYLEKKSLSKSELKKFGCSAAKPHSCLRLDPPQSNPKPGVYNVDQLRVTFTCSTFASSSSGAQHRSASVSAAAASADSIKFAYTLDGTPPMFTKTVNSHISILSSDKEPLLLKGRGIYIIRVVSCKEGLVESKIGDFAFRLIGGSHNNNNVNSSLVTKSEDIPPLFGVPLYDRFAAEKSEAKHSLTSSSKAVTANALAKSPTRNNNTNNNISYSSSSNNNNKNENVKIAANSVAISAARDSTSFREKGAAVVVQNPHLSTQVVSEMMNEQIRQSLAAAKKIPLPISAIDGDTIALVMPNQILRDPSPYYSTMTKNNNSNKNELDDIDLSGISLPLATALARRYQNHNNVINNGNHQHNDLSTISVLHQKSNNNNNTNTSLASVITASQILEEGQNNHSAMTTNGSRGLPLKIRDAMKFGKSHRGPLSSSPTSGNIANHDSNNGTSSSSAASGLPLRPASAKITGNAINHNNTSRELLLASLMRGNQNSDFENTPQQPPRSVTPALQRMYAGPLDSAAFPTPLTKLLEPVLPAPRRDATIRGELSQNVSLGAASSHSKLSIEEINARRNETRDKNSSAAFMNFAKVATEVPKGTPVFGAGNDVRRMEVLAKQEAATLASHSSIQMLWYEVREDALKKKKRYVQRDVESDASFNELMLTHDPAERTQEREYIKQVANFVADSGMSLPPVQANDYNCTATSFFPGSDIAATSASFLRFVYGLNDIAPFLKKILRNVPYSMIHAKLDSEASREMYKGGLPSDLNVLFQEYYNMFGLNDGDFIAPENSFIISQTNRHNNNNNNNISSSADNFGLLQHQPSFISENFIMKTVPQSVSKSFIRVAPNLGHLLLAFRWCLWNMNKIAEAPVLLLLQYCALSARPTSYSLGSEWEEVKQYVDHDGEIDHSVTTTVPHVAFEMAISLLRKNLDKMIFSNNNNGNDKDQHQQQQNENNKLPNAMTNSSFGSASTFSHAGSVVLNPLSKKKGTISAERRKTIMLQLSQQTLRENADKRERIREADALNVLVPWKTADNNQKNQTSNNNDDDDDYGDNGGGKNKNQGKNNNSQGGDKNNDNRKWQHNVSGTFIQDVYLAQILVELEPKLPRLNKIVKDASNINWELYHQQSL